MILTLGRKGGRGRMLMKSRKKEELMVGIETYRKWRRSSLIQKLLLSHHPVGGGGGWGWGWLDYVKIRLTHPNQLSFSWGLAWVSLAKGKTN